MISWWNQCNDQQCGEKTENYHWFKSRFIRTKLFTDVASFFVTKTFSAVSSRLLCRKSSLLFDPFSASNESRYTTFQRDPFCQKKPMNEFKRWEIRLAIQNRQAPEKSLSIDLFKSLGNKKLFDTEQNFPTFSPTSMSTMKEENWKIIYLQAGSDSSLPRHIQWLHTGGFFLPPLNSIKLKSHFEPGSFSSSPSRYTCASLYWQHDLIELWMGAKLLQSPTVPPSNVHSSYVVNRNWHE